MACSGAGKTTFLSTLCGRATYGVQTGRVLINGREDSIHRYKKVVGFVPQEDIMHRDLTVREILEFNAQVRLPKDLSSAEINERSVFPCVFCAHGLKSHYTFRVMVFVLCLGSLGCDYLQVTSGNLCYGGVQGGIGSTNTRS